MIIELNVVNVVSTYTQTIGLETATVHIIANTTHQFFSFFLSFVLYPTGWQKLLLW
jgi:hypothetical protein